jgi:hypothetical protein
MAARRETGPCRGRSKDRGPQPAWTVADGGLLVYTGNSNRRLKTKVPDNLPRAKGESLKGSQRTLPTGSAFNPLTLDCARSKLTIVTRLLVGCVLASWLCADLARGQNQKNWPDTGYYVCHFPVQDVGGMVKMKLKGGGQFGSVLAVIVTRRGHTCFYRALVAGRYSASADGIDALLSLSGGGRRCQQFYAQQQILVSIRSGKEASLLDTGVGCVSGSCSGE